MWYDGYLVDVSMDADSEIITAVNVLPGNGDEAADALELIRLEEATHGNDIEAISMDGAGFHGPLLRELEDPEGLHIDAYVPPSAEPDTGLFLPMDLLLQALFDLRHVPQFSAGGIGRDRRSIERCLATIDQALRVGSLH